MTGEKTMKRVLSILLAALIGGGVLTACGEQAEGNTPASTTAASDGNAAADTTAEETTRHMPDLPDQDLGGREFNIVLGGNEEHGITPDDISAEEQTGDTINDARYERNLHVQEKFNIKLVSIVCNTGTGGDSMNKVKKAVTAGDTTYDAAFLGGYDTCSLARNGMLYDMYTIPNLDLSQEWWDQNANNALTIKNHMFYTTGDISTFDDDATYVIMFNKRLANNVGLPNFYEMVKNGTWTLDNYKANAVTVHEDLNGDGVFDQNDRYGILIWDDSMMGVVNSTGTKCCIVNDNGEIELTIFNDKVVNAISSFFEVAFDNAVSITYQRSKYGGWDGNLCTSMFISDQALFWMRLMLDVANLRNMETDFGILPYMKYDESTPEYYCTEGSWHSIFVCVPISISDPELTGAVLEMLAAEGRYTTTPAYYDVALKGKYARDEESLEMLDIIVKARCYDLGWYYAIGGYNEEVMNLLRNFKDGFTTMYEKKATKAQKDIDKINAAFDEIG